MAQPNKRHPVLIFLSSTTASLISTLITNPIEIMKLNRQFVPLTSSQYPNKCAEPVLNKTLIEYLRNPEYIRTRLFNGLSVVLPQVLISNILFMQLYEYQKKRYMNHQWLHDKASLSTVISAVTSRTIVSLITSPMEAKRVRMSNMKDGKMFDMNMKQFGSSIRATLTRDISFSALYWTLVEVIRNRMGGGKEYRKVKKSNFDLLIDNALPGLIGGVLSSFITCPIDTVKTRIQTKSLTYYSMSDELVNIYRNEGLAGWFLGWKLRILKSASHSVMYLVLFEFLLDRLNRATKSYPYFHA